MPDAPRIPAEGAEVRGDRWPTEYRVGVTRTPAYLAAVASSAVPGLDAVAVRASRGAPGNRCDVGFVTDTQRRAWVVRVPTTSAVGAQLDTAADLLPLLHRRVPYGVPLPRGFLAVPEGRAVVYAYLHGRSVVLSEVVPGPGVAAEIGRAIAALHNVDRAVFDEAGVPVYDAETCRARHLGDLDRGAATGHVPTALLSRWERALEDVSAWRFAPTPVHARPHRGPVPRDLRRRGEPRDRVGTAPSPAGSTPRSPTRRTTSRCIVAECSPETFESIVEAYSVGPDRAPRPPPSCTGPSLVSELRLLTRLLDAVHAAEPPLITRRAAELRALDERTANEPDLVVTEPEAAPRLPTGGRWPPTPRPVRAMASGRVPEVREDDTQLLKTGTAADPTAVIPAEELDRLRAEPARRAERRRRPGRRVLVRGARALSVGRRGARVRGGPVDDDGRTEESLDEDGRARAIEAGGGPSRIAEPDVSETGVTEPESRAGGHRGRSSPNQTPNPVRRSRSSEPEPEPEPATRRRTAADDEPPAAPVRQPRRPPARGPTRRRR